MDLDTAKIDEAVLGLLYLTLHDHVRAWKSMDWDAMGRLHEKGYICDPVNKSKSVVLTESGLQEAELIATAQFTKASAAVSRVQYGGVSATTWPADGASGVLCRSAVDGPYFFRVYRPDGSFVDFDMRHDDLAVTIAPSAMASFYERGTARILDHSPAVLGLQPVSESDAGLGA